MSNVCDECLYVKECNDIGSEVCIARSPKYKRLCATVQIKDMYKKGIAVWNIADIICMEYDMWVSEVWNIMEELKIIKPGGTTSG